MSTLSIRPVIGLLVVTELLFWVAVISAWTVATSLVPSLTLHRMEWWPLLLASGLPTVGMMGHLAWRHRAVRSLADSDRLESVLSNYRMYRPTWKHVAWRWALGAAVIGWLDPKMGSRLADVETEGMDVMVALDVSNSMLAEDLGMPRLDLAKRTVERLLQAAAGDRMGLVVFAGDAYVQCPLTTDVEALKLFLGTVHPGMVPTQGTAVGRAIEVCEAGFEDGGEASRMIVVLTDGENHEDDVVAAAQRAREAGASVHFLGIATLEGAPIPTFDRRGRPSGFRADNDGTPVVSRLDEGTLLQAAQSGKGTYTRAGKGFVELSPLLKFKDDTEKATIASVSYVDYEHHLMPWLVLAMALLLLESLIPRGSLWRKAGAATVVLGACMPTTHAQTSLPSAAKTPLVQGTEAFRAGDMEEAAARFGAPHEGLETWGGHAAYNEGCALLQNGQTEEAGQAFGRALELTDDPALQARVHHNAAVQSLMAQDPEKAITHAKSALRLDPTNDDARHNLALAQRMLQQQSQNQNQEQEEKQDQNQNQGQEDNQEQEQDQRDGDDEGENEGENEGKNGGEDANDSSEEGESEESNPDKGEGEGDNQESQNEPADSQDEPTDAQPQAQEGKISSADMERILESLERQEAEVQAKLQAAKAGKGSKRTIEKDW